MSKKEVIQMGQEIEQQQFSNPKLKEVLPWKNRWWLLSQSPPWRHSQCLSRPSLRPALARPASVRETTVDTQLTPMPFLWSGRRADAWFPMEMLGLYTLSGKGYPSWGPGNNCGTSCANGFNGGSCSSGTNCGLNSCTGGNCLTSGNVSMIPGAACGSFISAR